MSSTIKAGDEMTRGVPPSREKHNGGEMTRGVRVNTFIKHCLLIHGTAQFESLLSAR